MYDLTLISFMISFESLTTQVTLRKYDPANLLRLPEKARTRAEAVDALRLCDRECARLLNQKHCVKNTKHLVATLIEHVFTQVSLAFRRRVGRAEDKYGHK